MYTISEVASNLLVSAKLYDPSALNLQIYYVCSGSEWEKYTQAGNVSKMIVLHCTNFMIYKSQNLIIYYFPFVLLCV